MQTTTDGLGIRPPTLDMGRAQPHEILSGIRKLHERANLGLGRTGRDEKRGNGNDAETKNHEKILTAFLVVRASARGEDDG